MAELSEIDNKNENKKSFNPLTFLRRSQEWLEVSGYHVGDIHSEDKPVLVTSGATVVGNIFALQVKVAGLLSGSVVANRVTIEKTGQIWGDLFTQTFQLNGGGKVQGWVSALEEEVIASMLQEQSLPGDSDSPDLVQPPNSQNGTPFTQERSKSELSAFHQLQLEVATAKTARAELEQSFEARLQEVAGDSSSKLSSLSNEVASLNSELDSTKSNLQETEETLMQRDAQIERQHNELELSRNLIQEQNESLTELKSTRDDLSNQLANLQQEKQTLDDTLQEKLKQLEDQADRIHNINTSMQSSLQHSSDLEESLVRWQELAEVNEKRVEELEQEISNKQFQIDESNKMIEMVKQQKQQVEEEWQMLHTELETIRKNPTRPLDEPDDDQINEEVLAAATAQVTMLEAELENLAQERAEQILWYRASLETSMSELETVRQQSAEQETLLATLQEKIDTVTQEAEERQKQLSNLQERNAELEQAVSEQETAVSDLKAKYTAKRDEWREWQRQAREEVTALRENLKQKENQVAAGEDDLSYHLQEIEKQGNRLAEAQALLAERELQLRKARTMVTKQNKAIKDLRSKTEAYIKKLQQKA